MKKEIRKNKLIQILKISSDSLLSAWSVSAPPRFYNNQSGLNYWKDDAAKTLFVNDDEKLNDILNNKIDPYIVEKSGDWSFFSSFFPNGEKIRKLWKKRSDKSFSSFVSWLKSSGLTDSNAIIAELERQKTEAIVKKEEIPAKIVSEVPLESSDKKNLSRKTEYNISGVSDENFYREILKGLGAPATKNNMLFLLAWRQAEGGRATFNPFNTTQRAEGATNYNKVGVKNYVSAEQGIRSTIKTISNGRYESIINALKRDSPPMVTADALVSSPWGTSDLIKKVISGYESGYSPAPHEIAKA